MLNLVLPPIPVVMSFIGSSADRSSSSAQLGIGKTYSRLLQLLWTVVHWWTAWPIYTGWVATTWRQLWPRPWRDKCMIEQRSATAVINDSRGWTQSLLLDEENVSLQLSQVIRSLTTEIPTAIHREGTDYYLMHQSIHLKWQRHILVLYGSISLLILLMHACTH